MKLQLPVPALAAPQHSQALRALLAPKKAVSFQPRLKVLLLPHLNYNPISLAVALSDSSSCSQSLSDNPNTIESA
jgi:hypothetical protein